MENILKQFQQVPTTCVSDVLRGLGNMDTSIKPLEEHYKVCGPAYTVKALANDNLVVLKAIRQAKSGDVLVVDSKGYDYNGIGGDFVMGMAKMMGIAGVVADGTIRDVVGIKKLNFPVFCTGVTVAAGGKAGAGEVNVPISCGGVAVNPGDIIIGDADGVVVVPKERMAEILKAAQEKEKTDQQRAQNVLVSADAVRAYLDKVLA